MERDRDTIWNRRTGNKPLLSSDTDSSTRTFPKRFGLGSQDGSGPRGSSTSNPFNNITPLATAGISSPTGGASNAFNLGSGAFASFGSSTKTPKTPGTAFDFSSKSTSEKKDKDKERPTTSSSKNAAKSSGEDIGAFSVSSAGGTVSSTSSSQQWAALKHSWVIWYRPPTGKNSDYEKSTKPMCRMSTVQEFWKVYSHLKRPSLLPTVSDYHFFKEGIRPVWEDEENRKGGKWVIRLKKGVCDRYWEDLLMALVGDQFAEASEEVCGAVLSVRSGEDVFSIWTKNDGGRNIKIRETVKRVLALPPDTMIIWKSHDDSIAQRTALDQARQDKTSGTGVGHSHTTSQGEKRRTTISSQDAGIPSTSVSGDSNLSGLGVRGTAGGLGDRLKGTG